MKMVNETSSGDGSSKNPLRNFDKSFIIKVVILVIVAILLLVAAIFTSIVYYQLSRLDETGLPRNSKLFSLIAMVLAWVAFVGVLLLLAYIIFNKDKQLNNALVIAAAFIIGALVLASAVLTLLLTLAFNSGVRRALFINSIIATAAAVAGFVFLVIGLILFTYKKNGTEKKETSTTSTTTTSTSTNQTTPSSTDQRKLSDEELRKRAEQGAFSDGSLFSKTRGQ